MMLMDLRRILSKRHLAVAAVFAVPVACDGTATIPTEDVAVLRVLEGGRWAGGGPSGGDADDCPTAGQSGRLGVFGSQGELEALVDDVGLGSESLLSHEVNWSTEAVLLAYRYCETAGSRLEVESLTATDLTISGIGQPFRAEEYDGPDVIHTTYEAVVIGNDRAWRAGQLELLPVVIESSQ